MTNATENTSHPSAAVPVIALASASFGVLGACLTLAGALLPVIVQELGISLMGAGSLLALYPFGFLLSVMGAGRLIDRFGVVRVLTVGVGVAALGFGAFGAAPSWVWGAALMFVAGLGFGATEVAANATLIAIGGDRSANILNFAHLFFGVGSFVAPVLATQTVAAGISWRLTFYAAGLLTLAIALAWSRVRLAEPERHPGKASEPHGASRPAVILLLSLTLAVYVGTEMGIGNWVSKYMVSVRGASLTEGGNALSAYWFGLALGRLLLTFVPRRGGDEALLIGLAMLSTIGLVAALWFESSAAVTLALTVTGFGFSGIFPGVVALGGRYQPHDVAGATSAIITGAGAGGIVIPWLMAAVAESAGLTVGMSFYAGMCGVMALLTMAVLKLRPR